MNQQTQYQSRIFSVEKVTYATQDGTEISKDVVRHPGSVGILPVLDSGELCLIRNRRISVDQVLLEIPAGTLEPPELPRDCAFRELTEETGFQAKEMQPLLEFFPAPGILDEKMHLFLANGLSDGSPARELGEEIENYIVTVKQAMSLIHTGEICDAKTILAILFYTQSLT